jgi:hypothetical protein
MLLNSRVFLVAQHRAGALEDGGNLLLLDIHGVSANGGGRVFLRLLMARAAAVRDSPGTAASPKDVFEGAVRPVGQIILAATLRLAEVLPVRRPVAGAAIASADR